MTTAPLLVVARRAIPADRAYILGSWSEAYKHAPKMRDLPWALYKQHVVPGLAAVLDRPDTQVLVATVPGAADIVGWIAFVRGRRVSTVHWTHTRFRVGTGGEQLRRRGVMSALVTAAELGPRWVYTHRGPKAMDAQLVGGLQRRGITAVHVPMREWAA